MKRANPLDVVPLPRVRYDDTTKLEGWHRIIVCRKEGGAHIVPMEVLTSGRRVKYEDSV